MEIKVELGASSVALNEAGLTIQIRREQIRANYWKRMGEKLQQAQEKQAWLYLPFQTVEEGKARWKKLSLDLLSLVVYLLVLRPEDKLVRLLEGIDWGEIDRRCAPLYKNKERGCRAYAPQVLFRLLLLPVVHGLRCESALLRQAESNLAWRWFCGFGLLTPLPTAATLCIFRQRLGAEKFEEILGWIIQECQRAGLVNLEKAYFDFTGVEANATQLSPYERTVVLAKAMSAYLAGLTVGDLNEEASLGPLLQQLVAEAARDVLSQEHPSVKKLKPQQLSNSLQRLEKEVAEMPQGPRWWQQIRQFLSNWRSEKAETRAEGVALLEKLAAAPSDTEQQTQLSVALKAHLGVVGQELKAVVPHAWGDLSARVGTLSRGCTVCGYLAGYLVDSSHNIIIGLASVAANVGQSRQLKGVLQQSKRLLGHLPQQLGLDSAFDHDHLYTDLQDEAIELFITPRNRRGPKDCFNAAHFCFDDADQLCCPNEQPMTLRYGPYKNGRAVYQGVDCSTCPLFDQCVPKGKQERTLNIDVESHRRWQANRSKSRTDEGQYIFHQRFAREGLFGHANTYHNGDRNPYRAPSMNRVSDCLTAFVLNLEKLANHRATASAL